MKKGIISKVFDISTPNYPEEVVKLNAKNKIMEDFISHVIYQNPELVKKFINKLPGVNGSKVIPSKPIIRRENEL